jgi:hypothetical protein
MGLAGCVYRMAGLDVRLSGLEPAKADDGSPVDPITGGLWWHGQWAGQPFLLHLNEGLASAWARSAGVELAELSEDALDLLGAWQTASWLPSGLTWVRAASDRRGLQGLPAELEPTRRWQAHHARTREQCGFEACLHALPDFALQGFYAAFESFVVERDPQPLAGMHWSMPLVAARWDVDASVLADLDLGDVLFLES